VRLIPAYRPRASALHSARPGVAASYCLALALVGVAYRDPYVLTGAMAAIVAAAVLAGVGRETARSLALALPLALLVALINPIVYQGGDTLLVRGWHLFGRSWDITLEATVAGLLAGFRVIVVIAACGLLSAAVDPDGLLKLFRRLSYRSALTAALATRLVPVIARDAARMSDAARCRPESPGRLAVTRAAVTGALDRATEVAAALEVRGYALASKPVAARAAWSRHDLGVALSAGLIAAAALAGRAAGVGEVELYPSIELPAGSAELALALALPLAASAPLVGRSARLGVAHA
jgi:energy-coupling factor transport system permease protein